MGTFQRTFSLFAGLCLLLVGGLFKIGCGSGGVKRHHVKGHLRRVGGAKRVRVKSHMRGGCR